MQNIIKNPTIETDTFTGDENNTDDIEEDIEKNDSENLDLPMADLCSYAIAMTHIYWRKKNTTSYLKSSILSHLHHSLHIANNTSGMATRPICYNINSLKSDFRDNLELGIRTKVFTDKTIM